MNSEQIKEHTFWLESPPLLPWQPGELLFSLASRHHFFWGNRLASMTSISLFGHPRGGSHHDFPNRIDEFVKKTNAAYGSATDICAERTLLSYYRKFADEKEESALVASMRGESVGGLKFRLGILTSRFRANHPLKACPDCILEDRRESGWSVWHVKHQFPGVWVCTKHQCPLLEYRLKANGAERFSWQLPNLAKFKSTDPAFGETMTHEALASLAALTDYIIGLPGSFKVEPRHLHKLYRIELEARNLLTAGGNFRLKEIAKDFARHVAPLRRIAEFAALPSSAEDAYGQLSRHLRAPRTGTHPLRHLVMINWLIRDGEQFKRKYSNLSSYQISQSKAEATSPPIPYGGDKKELLFIMMQGGASSARQTADALCIDTATALVWATQMGLQVRRRPKILKTDVRQALISCLQSGDDKAAAAAQFGISVTTVTHVLRTEIGLHSTWRAIRYERTLSGSRSAWVALLKAYGHLGMKLIRNSSPSTYAWLYRNDRSWLAANSCPGVERPQGKRQAALWDERDAFLSGEVQKAALKIRHSLGNRKLRLWHLYQEIPELRAKLSALRYLPLTVSSIEVALERKAREQKSDSFDF